MTTEEDPSDTFILSDEQEQAPRSFKKHRRINVRDRLRGDHDPLQAVAALGNRPDLVAEDPGVREDERRVEAVDE